MASAALFCIGMLMGACTVTAYACCRVGSRTRTTDGEAGGTKARGGAARRIARPRPFRFPGQPSTRAP